MMNVLGNFFVFYKGKTKNPTIAKKFQRIFEKSEKR